MMGFTKEEHYSNNTGKFLTNQSLNMCTNTYNPKSLIYISIYKFNDLLLSHCRSMGFTDCGTLRKSVYKSGRYYDTIVISYYEGMNKNA